MLSVPRGVLVIVIILPLLLFLLPPRPLNSNLSMYHNVYLHRDRYSCALDIAHRNASDEKASNAAVTFIGALRLNISYQVEQKGPQMVSSFSFLAYSGGGLKPPLSFF